MPRVSVVLKAALLFSKIAAISSGATGALAVFASLLNFSTSAVTGWKIFDVALSSSSDMAAGASTIALKLSSRIVSRITSSS